jgi:hypothetical protein
LAIAGRSWPWKLNSRKILVLPPARTAGGKYSGSGGKKHTDGEKAAEESADIKGEKTARERQ